MSLSTRSTGSTNSSGRSRISQMSNKTKAIDDLKKTYARRNFLKHVLNPEFDLKNTLYNKHINPHTSANARSLINRSFESYKSEATKSIPQKITSLQRNFDPSHGRIGRVVDTTRGVIPRSNNYTYLTTAEKQNVNKMVSNQISAISDTINSGYHNYNTNKLKNNTINGIDNFLGFKTNNTQVSSISSESSYGGKAKKGITKDKKGITKDKKGITKGKKRITKGKKRITKGKKRITKK